MSFNFTVRPLTDRFEDPIYLVLVERIPQGDRMVSQVVIFEHDRRFGKFDFGNLTPIISRWPTVMVNRLKNEIKKVVFSQL